MIPMNLKKKHGEMETRKNMQTTPISVPLREARMLRGNSKNVAEN